MHRPRTINGILRKIEEIAGTGGYIYRGEPQHYDNISSNLYRVFLNDKEFDVETTQFDIEVVQEEMLERAKFFTRRISNEFESLSKIQHYGGKTNLIDFTTDYLIALFMACDGYTNEDRRVILQEKMLMDPYIEQPYEPINRVIAQKSVFLQHPDGFIQPNEDDIINIRADLKQPMLIHLRNSHNISVETVYNDIHGFIKDQDNHLEFYKTIHKGLTSKQIGDSEHG